ncbi:MAG: GIY-YIG nuclease family protein [Anaerolineales bacterium]|nr:GIY-YIG nuclease family protein [Anaerolineales bacterium]
MTFIDSIKQILLSSNEPMTPQEIREKVKEQYPQFYGTESHLTNVQKGHYKNLEHAVLAQIYSTVRTNDSFSCDKTVKPMKVTLVENDEDEDMSSLNIEAFEENEGIVYVLKTDTYTKNGKEIIKIGITAGDLDKRINQLYSTGVPYKFKVHKTYRTKNFFELESALHKLLDPFKLNKSREFFTEEAIIYIDKIFDIHESIQKAAK